MGEGQVRGKQRRNRWFAVAGLVVALLAPVGFAIAAPQLVRLPEPRPSWSVPAVPPPSADARPSLDGLVDPLPLVMRDLPDEASQRAIRDYDAATLLEPQGAADMFLNAWNALVYAPEDEPSVKLLGGALLSQPLGSGTLASCAASPLGAEPFATAMPALASDPSNADRISNAAVALNALGMSTAASGKRAIVLDRTIDTDPVKLQDNARWLLEAAYETFGPNRSVLLNLAFVRSPWGGDAIAPVKRQLDQDPSDGTARLLLASLQSRRSADPSALEQAVRTLQPLVDDGQTAPLGHAALGDAYLVTAGFRQPESPFLARSLAERALSEYDAALAITTDAGLYAGRALALDFLAASPSALDAAATQEYVSEAQRAAIASQQQAVVLAPRSIPLLIGLAALQERTGDAAEMRSSARSALSLALEGSSPPLASVRLIGGPDYAKGDRGYLGLSYGSDRDRTPVSPRPCAQGGVSVLALDVIKPPTGPLIIEQQLPEFSPVVSIAGDQVLTQPTPAYTIALRASILLGDPAGITADAHLLAMAGTEASHPNGAAAPPPPDASALEAIAAANLVAERPLPPGVIVPEVFNRATSTLMQAGRFADAAELCRRAAEAPVAAGFNRMDALQCLGEASYLSRDFASAATAFGQLYEAATASTAETAPSLSGPPIAYLRVQLAAAAQAAGRADEARRLFTLAATDPNWTVLALTKLGDLNISDPELGALGAAAALAHYDLALATLDAAEAADALPSHLQGDRVPPSTTPQRLHNNHGIARLRLAQKDSSKPPDCTGEREACLAAGEDFAAALAADRLNPFYLNNAGWVARLLDDRATARTHLAQAAALSPGAFQALNDLGVLAAQDGDRVTARRALVDALAVAPDYDLAAWNLGILELERGVEGIPHAQAYLARAIDRSPSFQDHALAYKDDERFYSVTLGLSGELEHGWGFSRGYGLVVATLSTVTVVASTAQLLRPKVLSKVGDMLEDYARDQLPRGGAHLRARVERFLPEGHLAPLWQAWAPWLLTIPVLALVTAWPVWEASAAAEVATVVMALFATAMAVVVHELGHRSVAAWLNARVTPAVWGSGVVLALLFLLSPLRLSSGPYLGHRVEGTNAGRAWWVYWGGPAANVAVALAAYMALLVEPLPLLRLIAQIQLAAASYALLPFKPLDGAELKSRWPAVLAGFGLLLACTGVLVASGRW
jgi:tetratricopeptide (TPR) repeat protein